MNCLICDLQNWWWIFDMRIGIFGNWGTLKLLKILLHLTGGGAVDRAIGLWESVSQLFIGFYTFCQLVETHQQFGAGLLSDKYTNKYFRYIYMGPGSEKNKKISTYKRLTSTKKVAALRCAVLLTPNFPSNHFMVGGWFSPYIINPNYLIHPQSKVLLVSIQRKYISIDT